MKKYKLEFELKENGDLVINSENEGFTALELFGLLSWKQRDIENQICGDIKPDIVSRTVITDTAQ